LSRTDGRGKVTPMADSPGIQDVEMFGKFTSCEVVRAEAGDDREWTSNAPICSLLKIHPIRHVGRMWAKPPFKVIRLCDFPYRLT
jgi:hypothetical protein